MKHPLVIGYVCVEDPRDRRTWSGTNFFLLRALEQMVERVELFAPLRPDPVLFLAKVFNFLSTRLLGKRYNYRDSHLLSRAYAKQLERALKQRPVDLIVAPAGLATTALLRTDIPIIHVNDRCLHGAVGYHRILRDLFVFSLKDGLSLERAALNNAALTVYASDWASEAARGTGPEVAARIMTIPFGANLEEPPAAPAQRDAPGEPWTLLFLGVNWEDKGGPVAYAALQELKQRGHRVRLVVAGCEPPASCDDPGLQREGFLNKNDPAQRKRLEELLRSADALVLPTRFEAYGIVCCEAAAYGLPVFATRTGGIPTIVQHDMTGLLMDPDADGVAYADAIASVLGDPVRWSAMRVAARLRYLSVLNWDAFVAALLRAVEAHGLINKAR